MLLPSIVVVRVSDDKIIWFSSRATGKGKKTFFFYFFPFLCSSCCVRWEIERTLARPSGPDQGAPLPSPSGPCAAAADGIKKQSVSSSSSSSTSPPIERMVDWSPPPPPPPLQRTTCWKHGAIDSSHRRCRWIYSVVKGNPGPPTCLSVSYSINQGRKQHAWCAFFLWNTSLFSSSCLSLSSFLRQCWSVGRKKKKRDPT